MKPELKDLVLAAFQELEKFSIPGLGTFIQQVAEGEDTKDTSDDGSLVVEVKPKGGGPFTFVKKDYNYKRNFKRFIQNKTNVPASKAEALVNKLGENILKDLENEKEFMIGDIGMLATPKKGRLDWVNFKDSPDGMENGSEDSTEVKNKRFMNKMKYAVYGVGILMLLATAGLVYKMYFEKAEPKKEEPKKEVQEIEEEPEEESEPVYVAPRPKRKYKKKKVAYKAPTDSYKYYHIVVQGDLYIKQAYIVEKQYAAKGLSVQKIQGRSNDIYRISVYRHTDEAKVMQKLKELKASGKVPEYAWKFKPARPEVK